MRTKLWLISGIVVVLLSGFLGVLHTGQAEATPGMPPVATPNPLSQALYHGKWPAQVAAHVGAIRPDRHGPQRNDPA